MVNSIKVFYFTKRQAELLEPPQDEAEQGLRRCHLNENFVEGRKSEANGSLDPSSKKDCSRREKGRPELASSGTMLARYGAGGRQPAPALVQRQIKV